MRRILFFYYETNVAKIIHNNDIAMSEANIMILSVKIIFFLLFMCLFSQNSSEESWSDFVTNKFVA